MAKHGLPHLAFIPIIPIASAAATNLLYGQGACHGPRRLIQRLSERLIKSGGWLACEGLRGSGGTGGGGLRVGTGRGSVLGAAALQTNFEGNQQPREAWPEDGENERAGPGILLLADGVAKSCD